MSFFNEGSVKKSLRFENIVKELDWLCTSKELRIKLNVDKKRLILRAVKPQLWETLLYPVLIIAFWIWFFIDKTKSDIGAFALLSLTGYWIWTYFEIAKGINEIVINLETDDVKVVNLDIIGRHLYKTAGFKIEGENRVFRKAKRFTRYSNNFRIYVETKEAKLNLIDVEGNFASDRFKFALSFLLTTKCAKQEMQ